jgi:hypothetical protein
MKFLKRFFRKERNNMPTIQEILASIQADVSNLATYVAGLTPGNVVPANITTALTAVQAAQKQLNADASASPFVLATVVTDVASLTTAVAALAAAVASPSTP